MCYQCQIFTLTTTSYHECGFTTMYNISSPACVMPLSYEFLIAIATAAWKKADQYEGPWLL